MKKLRNFKLKPMERLNIQLETTEEKTCKIENSYK